MFGTEVMRQPPHRVARQRVGYVPEGRRVFPNLTVEDNLKVPQGSSEGPFDIPRIYQLFPRLEERKMNRGRQLSGVGGRATAEPLRAGYKRIARTFGTAGRV